MRYTIEELEKKMHALLIHKEQIQEICKRRYTQTFDVVYNISSELREWSPYLEERLKDRAVVGKRTYLDKTKTSYQQEENFNSLIKFIEEIYNEAFKIIVGELKLLGARF